MNNAMLSDRIEKFILEMLSKQTDDEVLLKRKDVADLLECAPSQVTYVVNTRFSSDDRFMVESRRGSGGYIKISLRTQSSDAGRPSGSFTGNPQKERKNAGRSQNTNSIEFIQNGLNGYLRMLMEYDMISNQEYRLIYAMTHTMLEYCPETQRKEAAKHMIHSIEWALKGE